MSLIDMIDTPSPLPSGLSTTPIDHLRIPDEELMFPELAYSYCIETFVIDLQWINHGVPITREECQAAWFAYLDREWNKYQDADYIPPDEGVEVPSEIELREQLDVMIAGAYENNWHTVAEMEASEAKREPRRRLRRYGECVTIVDEIAEAKKEASIDKPKVVRKSRAEKKKKRQEAALVRQLEIAMSQMDFETNANISKIISKSTVQGRKGGRATRVVKQSAEKIAAKMPSKPIKAIEQRVDPSEGAPCQDFVHYTDCTCDMEDQNKLRAQLDAAETGMEMDVDIPTNAEELSK